MAVGNVVIAQFGTRLVAFELGALVLGTGVSAMASGALRYLVTVMMAADEADANQATVSLLTNVGVLVGGSLWGSIVASSTTDVATVRTGLLVLTALLLPLSLGILLVPTRGQRLLHKEYC
jgi:hypothetical protein